MFGLNHLCVTMLHKDSTIQKCFRVRRFSVPCQPFGRSSHPVRTTICHCSIRPDPPLCREGSIQLASVRTPLSTRTVSDSFQVPIKGRSINRPNDVVSRPDARLLKARIAIQISPSGRLTAVVRTRVHQRRKLHVEVQSSGRSSPMVRTLEAL
jgi:hypothetical protein